MDRNGKILDFGCGYGRVCEVLRAGGFQRVVGVDSSPVMIERARNRLPDLVFEVVSSPALPFADGAFDAVMLFAVLTCVVSNAAQRRLIQELARLLRPGGILYVSDFPLQEDARNRARYERDREAFENYGTFRTEDGGVMRHHAPEWIASLLGGFRQREMIDIDVMTMNGHAARGFQYLGEKR